MRNRFASLAVAVVLVHLAVNLAHGWAHLTIPVPNTPAQNASIIPVIGIAPLVAAWLLLTGWTTAGAFGVAHAQRADRARTAELTPRVPQP